MNVRKKRNWNVWIWCIYCVYVVVLGAGLGCGNGGLYGAMTRIEMKDDL